MRVCALLDVLSINTREDCAVVLPSLEHAIHYWPILVEMFLRRHGEDFVSVTKTAIISRRTRHAVRLWVPYTVDPTQPLDWRSNRRGYTLINLYGLSDGRE